MPVTRQPRPEAESV